MSARRSNTSSAGRCVRTVIAYLAIKHLLEKLRAST
jgi:hypothetical protein